MNRIFKLPLFLSLILVVGLACNMPATGATEEPVATSIPTLTPEVATEEPIATPEVAECTPSVTTTTDANVRNGPGVAYGIYGLIPQNGTATVAGKNSAGDWWYIEFAAGEGGHGWIAGSVTSPGS